nr:glypican-5-like [Cherax quadricarinatus]
MNPYMNQNAILGVPKHPISAVIGVVESALANSEHRALNVFQATYPRLAPAARQVLHDLYSALRVGLTDTDDRALENAMGTFWDDLFPPVYHSVLHARLAPFSRRYTECLRDAQRVVQPWGIVPTLVGEPLLRGLHSARLLLHSLDVGAQVVKTASNFAVPSECGDAAARMQYCGACHGTLAPPCPGMCLNVARGCLAPLAEVDGAWADLAGAVSRVQQSLQAVRLAQLLHQLPDKLSEAVMVALERGPQLQKKWSSRVVSSLVTEEFVEEVVEEVRVLRTVRILLKRELFVHSNVTVGPLVEASMYSVPDHVFMDSGEQVNTIRSTLFKISDSVMSCRSTSSNHP